VLQRAKQERLALIRACSFNSFHLRAIWFDGTPIPLMQQIYADKKYVMDDRFSIFHFTFFI